MAMAEQTLDKVILCQDYNLVSSSVGEFNLALSPMNQEARGLEGELFEPDSLYYVRA